MLNFTLFKNGLTAITDVKPLGSIWHGESIWWEPTPHFTVTMTSVLLINLSSRFLLSPTVASSPLFLPKNPDRPHAPNYFSLSPLSLTLDSRREVTLASTARNRDPVHLHSCHPCWNLESEFLNDSYRLFHLCSSFCTVLDTGPQ